MKREKTDYNTISTALEIFNQYFTVQNNEINQYARICFTDDYKKDNYKIFKDFAIYYDRVDSYKISIADSTLVDCKVFKESHEQTEKTRALEFTVRTDNLISTIYEILAQRLLQTEKALELNIKTVAKRQSKAKSKKA